jgi:alkylation response protein AidB-like acyl-CoA dehydrogenase
MSPVPPQDDALDRGALEIIFAGLSDLSHPIKTATSHWASAALASTLTEREPHSTFSYDDWRACADYGIQSLLVPKSMGGSGADLGTTLLTLEGLGHGCRDNGLTFGMCAQMFTVQNSLVRFGSEQQRARWLPPMMSGKAFGSFCISEPESGSDAFALTTTAEKVDGGYRLNGVKAHITLGPIADVMVVFATTNPAAKRWGVTAFLVDTKTPGVTPGENMEKMGVRTTPFGQTVFDNAFVPDADLLGPVGAGASIFSSVLDEERAFMFVSQLGAAQRVLEQTIERAKTRKQFGQPIGSFQAVAHRIAAMKLNHETARLLMYKCAILLVQQKSFTTEAALTKLHISEMAAENAMHAIQIHGASGYITETGIEREMRDAIGGLVYSGTSDMMRNIVARMSGLNS